MLTRVCPQNLLEQYQKAANVFFLFVVILSSINVISAFSPYPTAMAIIFILGLQVSAYCAEESALMVLVLQAIKDGWEDWQRIKADK